MLRRLPALVDEIILVDGSSTDDTVAVTRALHPRVVVVTDEGRGKGLALRQGFAAARGDIVVMIDADGSMDPREIERLVEPLQDGAFDLVKGSRYVELGGSDDLSPLRSAGNRFFCVLFNTLYRERFTDLCYGYAAFRRESLDDLALESVGFEVETELMARASRLGLRIGEVPSFEAPRRYGSSNLNTFRDGFRVLRMLLRARVAREAARPAAKAAAEIEVPYPVAAVTGAAQDRG